MRQGSHTDMVVAFSERDGSRRVYAHPEEAARAFGLKAADIRSLIEDGGVYAGMFFDWTCLATEDRRAYCRAYYRKHRAEILERAKRRYRERTREEIERRREYNRIRQNTVLKDYHREYYLKHREEILERARLRRAERTPEEIERERERRRRYRQGCRERTLAEGGEE